jgi:hypothetical protein
MSEQERSEWSNDLRNKYGIAQPEAPEVGDYSMSMFLTRADLEKAKREC